MYTESMVARLKESQPLDFSKAEALASEFGVSARSVVSKAVSLGLEYTKAEATSGAKRVRKADIVRALESALGVPVDSLTSLERAGAEDLTRVLQIVSRV